MRPPTLGRVGELQVRDAGPAAPPELAEAVSALLFGLTLGAPAARVATPTATPLERACRETAESAVSLETAPHTHVSARALECGSGADAGERRRAAHAGPSSGDVEALVRLAAARSAAPVAHVVLAPSAVAPQLVATQPAPPPAPPRVAVPALLSAQAAQVEFAEGGADATIEIAHPELGPIRLEIALAPGGVALRALTPSTVTAAALRALAPAMARALTARGLAFRSLRVDVGSDSRATVSRSRRRRTDFEEEA
jgi:hypothetical protein